MLHLARVELGFGGKVVEMSETRIKVQTQVLSCLDTAIFEGTALEMRPVVELACLYTEAGENFSELIVGETLTFFERMSKEVSGMPFFITALAPILVGGNRLKIAVMLSCGIRDEEDIRVGLKARIEDIVTAHQLSRDGLCSFRDALSI